MEIPSPPIPTIPSIPTTEKTKRFSAVVLVVLVLIGLVVGGLIGFALTYSNFNSRLNTLQNQLQSFTQSPTNTVYPNSTYVIGSNVSLSNLYQQVKSSVVIVQDLVPVYNFFGNLAGYSQQQGSGFVTTIDTQQVVVTNNHVIQDAVNETVTFADGNSYPAKVLGSDPTS